MSEDEARRDRPVVETINAILNGEDNFILLLQRPQLERIRDEIVALRESLSAIRAEEREKVAAFMLDTMEYLLAELGRYLDHLHQSLDEV